MWGYMDVKNKMYGEERQRTDTRRHERSNENDGEKRKNKEEYIEKENKKTAPAGKTNREQVAVQLRKWQIRSNYIIAPCNFYREGIRISDRIG